MAESPDKGRFFNFMANGGGTVTFRMVVPGLLIVIGTLVTMMWNDLRSGQRDQVQATQNLSASLAIVSARVDVHAARLDTLDGSNTRLWGAVHDNSSKLIDHEHRISVIEGTLKAR